MRSFVLLLIAGASWLACSPAALAATPVDGMPLDVMVDLRGCIQAPLEAGSIIRARSTRLAGDAIFFAALARNGCAPDDATWRLGPVAVERRGSSGPVIRARVQVRRRDTIQADEWLVTGILDSAIRVQSPYDQCSPRSFWRLVETDDEVRVRYGRVPGEGGCTTMLMSNWGRERALRLQRPLGNRTLVIERSQVRSSYLNGTCNWFVSSLQALLGTSSSAERLRLARTAPRYGYEADEFAWSRVLVPALRSDDRASGARIARGVRRDMRLQAFPAGCERDPDLPAVESSAPTELVAAGYFQDARLVGLDAERRVTWAQHLGGIVESVSICPGGKVALVAERVEGRTWDVLVRTSFVDLDTGTAVDRLGVRRMYAEDLLSLGATCMSGVTRTGWLTTDHFLPSEGVDIGRRATIVDKIEGRSSARIRTTEMYGGTVVGGRLFTSEFEYRDEDQRMRFGWLDLTTGVASPGPWMAPGSATLSPGGTRMLVDRGDMDVYDATGGVFRLLRTIPDQRPPKSDQQIARDSVIWVDERRVRKHEGVDDRGRMFDIDVDTGEVVATSLWPRGSMVPMLEHRGDLLSYDSWFMGKLPGLRRLDPATNSWLQASTLAGDFEFVVAR